MEGDQSGSGMVTVVTLIVLFFRDLSLFWARCCDRIVLYGRYEPILYLGLDVPQAGMKTTACFYIRAENACPRCAVGPKTPHLRPCERSCCYSMYWYWARVARVLPTLHFLRVSESSSRWTPPGTTNSTNYCCAAFYRRPPE